MTLTQYLSEVRANIHANVLYPKEREDICGDAVRTDLRKLCAIVEVLMEGCENYANKSSYYAYPEEAREALAKAQAITAGKEGE